MSSPRRESVIATATAAALLTLGVFAPAPSPALGAAANGSSIEIWVRGAGPGRAGEPATRERLAVLALDGLPLTEAKRIDVQYHGAFTYRGVDLETIIARYAPPPGADLALLHFANGMQIPLAFRDTELMKRLSPFLARAMQMGPHAPMRLGRFPNVSRPRSGFVDVRPITFVGNKLVVSDGGHPDVPSAAQEVLSPWQQTDSLTGIELVSRNAYFAQFDVDPDPAVQAGHRLFVQSCQFCHGVRHAGAAFGWDFVEPTPIYDYRGQRNLFHHIKYKPLDASARGLEMPALSYMTEEDARSIWLWLKAVATRPLRPYAP